MEIVGSTMAVLWQYRVVISKIENTTLSKKEIVVATIFVRSRKRLDIYYERLVERLVGDYLLKNRQSVN